MIRSLQTYNPHDTSYRLRIDSYIPISFSLLSRGEPVIFLYIGDGNRNLIEIQLIQELTYLRKFVLIDYEFHSHKKLSLNKEPVMGLPVLDIDITSCTKSSWYMPAMDIHAPFSVYVDETTVEIQFNNAQKHDEILEFGAVLFFLQETELVGVSFDRSLATDFLVDRILKA